MSREHELNCQPDEKLVAGTLHGQKECFGVLVERYWRASVTVALARTKHPDWVEDIAQESLMQAYAHLAELRDRSRFSGWLTRIVAQTSIKHARMQDRALRISQMTEASFRRPAQEDADPTIPDLLRRQVVEAVGHLPRKLQTVVILRFVSGLSTDEIARQLSKRPGTVRVWLHRAYERLRSELKPVLE
ncbi:MAG: RNA polymerase sigma factor [Phycisphaerae bacterium]|nr:RNA polymerase sigma factor [Phycisphaerae bacterium]